MIAMSMERLTGVAAGAAVVEGVVVVVAALVGVAQTLSRALRGWREMRWTIMLATTGLQASEGKAGGAVYPPSRRTPCILRASRKRCPRMISALR